MFNVDEVESKVRNFDDGTVEIFDNLLDLAVGQKRIVRGKPEPAIEDRVMIENARFVPMVDVWPTVASGMSELEADHRIGIRSDHRAVFVEQDLAELREVSLRVIGNDQLIRVGSAIVRNGNRFPAPDQTSTGAAETPPSAPCELGRLAIWRAIPTLHWLDGDSVPDFEISSLQRATQRRLISDNNIAITRNRYSERSKMILKAIRVFQACQPHDGRRAQAVLLSAGKNSAATAPTIARPIRIRHPRT
jgi:hypothetical protein